MSTNATATEEGAVATRGRPGNGSGSFMSGPIGRNLDFAGGAP